MASHYIHMRKRDPLEEVRVKELGKVALESGLPLRSRQRLFDGLFAGIPEISCALGPASCPKTWSERVFCNNLLPHRQNRGHP